MFTVAKISTNKNADPIGYVLEVAHQQDYYNEKEKIVGKWQGIIAEKMGLTEKDITPESNELTKVFNGINPTTNAPLTQRNTKIRFFDFQNSCDKSISIMATLGGDNRLIKIHEEVTSKILKEIEKFAQVRERKGEKYNTKIAKDTGSLLISKFTHLSSRALDPQLHTHCLIANATYDPETDQYYALENEKIYKNLALFSRMYDNELAKEIKKLGYQIEYRYTEKGTVKGFKIKGISDDLCRKYSKRRLNLEEEIKVFKTRFNREPTRQELNKITKFSRAGKMYHLSYNDIRKFQYSQLSKDDKKSLKNIKNNLSIIGQNTEVEDLYSGTVKAVNLEMDHLIERDSIVKINDLKKEVLNNHIGDVDIEVMDQYINTENSFITIKDYITKKEAFTEEIKAIEYVNKNKNILSPLNEIFKPFSSTVHKDLEINNNYDFTAQRQITKKILSSKDRVLIFRGVAGSGKTTTIAEIDSGLREAGKKAFYFAPFTGAVENLNNDEYFIENGIEANTVASLLTKAKNGNYFELSNNVLVIDEASLISVEDGNKLLNICSDYNCRIIFVGDAKQHSAVSRGEFMRILEDYSDISKYELTKVIRQRNKEHLDIVYNLAGGNTRTALTKLDKIGWITEEKKYIEHAAEKYIEIINNGAAFEKILAISPTNKELDTFTDLIREKLVLNGHISKESIKRERFVSYNLTDARKKQNKYYKIGDAVVFNEKSGQFSKNEKRIIKKINDNHLILDNGKVLYFSKSSSKFELGKMKQAEIRVGDLIRPTANDRKAGLVNGKLYTVKSIDNNRVIMEDHMKKKEIHLDKNFCSFNYGFVVTSHRSQGATVEYTVIAAKRQDAKAAYVSLSRSRDKVYLFTDSREKLFKSSIERGDKDAVHDIDLNYEKLIKNKDPEYIKEVRKVKVYEYYNRKINNSTLDDNLADEYIRKRNYMAYLMVNNKDRNLSEPVLKALKMYNINPETIYDISRNFKVHELNIARSKIVELNKEIRELYVKQEYEINNIRESHSSNIVNASERVKNEYEEEKKGPVNYYMQQRTKLKEQLQTIVEERDILAYEIRKDKDNYTDLLKDNKINPAQFNKFAESGEKIIRSTSKIKDFINCRNDEFEIIMDKAVDIISTDKNYRNRCENIEKENDLSGINVADSIEAAAYRKITSNLNPVEIDYILEVKEYNELLKQHDSFWKNRRETMPDLFPKTEWAKINKITHKLEILADKISKTPELYEKGLDLFSVDSKRVDVFVEKYKKKQDYFMRRKHYDRVFESNTVNPGIVKQNYIDLNRKANSSPEIPVDHRKSRPRILPDGFGMDI